jgi:hypothetical protein
MVDPERGRARRQDRALYARQMGGGEKTLSTADVYGSDSCTIAWTKGIQRGRVHEIATTIERFGKRTNVAQIARDDFNALVPGKRRRAWP